jgi:hypothetical protein
MRLIWQSVIPIVFFEKPVYKFVVLTNEEFIPMTEAEHDDDSDKKKETARDLRKRNKRLQDSRDALKEKSRQQSERIRSLTGKALDLEESRDLWKKHCDSWKEEKNSLEIQLKMEKQRGAEMVALVEERERLTDIEKKSKEAEKIKYEEEINELKKKLKKLTG